MNTAVGVDPAARVSGAAATRLTCQSPHGWDLQTGTLGALQRWALVKAALPARRRGMGPRGPLGRASHRAMEDIRRPPSPWVTAALQQVERFTPSWLLNQCFRTHLWGTALAPRAGLKPDLTLLALCALMHDVALTDEHLPRPRTCFAVHSGHVPGALLEGTVPAHVRQAVANAVALHLDTSVDVRLSQAAHLLHEGAKMDALGSRVHHVDRDTRTAVLRAHPRLGFKACQLTVFQQRAASAPGTRLPLLLSLGLGTLVKRAPFDG